MKFLKDKLNLRLYQETIFSSASKKNCLVVLPTGLGKTMIAIALAALRENKGKILMMAPTKPLINQHRKTFSEYFTNIEKINVISGEIAPKLRKDIWNKSKIVFATPQTIKKDLIYSRISLDDVSLVVFDEAHRAVGDYAYVYIARKYINSGKKPRILGLTASPGSDRLKIKEVCSNLFIDIIESRDRDHKEVRDFVKAVKISYEFIELPNDIRNISKFLNTAASGRINILYDMGFIKTKNISKKYLLSFQKYLLSKSKNYYNFRALSLISQIIKIKHAIELLEAESIESFIKYLNKVESQKNKAANSVCSDFEVKRAKLLGLKFLDNNIEHPKLDSLLKVIKKQISKKKDSKILVFTEYRTNINPIINKLYESKISCNKFIGQSSKLEKGMSQDDQIKTLNKFKRNEFNVLVATSVAEEGLDIPSVDMVIFYSVVPSAIRSIQRKGRTGRHNYGKISILLTKNTKDEAYYWIAHKKEKKMKYIIDSISSNEDLTKFIK